MNFKVWLGCRIYIAGGVYAVHSLRSTSGAKPANLLLASRQPTVVSHSHSHSVVQTLQHLFHLKISTKLNEHVGYNHL